MAWWMWILAGFLLVVVELTTVGGFYFLFFGAGAFLVGLLAVLNIAADPAVQWLMFSITSVAALMLFRRPLLDRFQSDVPSREVDNLVGEVGKALEDIVVSGFGKVELRGTAWNARNDGDQPLIQGQRCKVERVEGLSLWVRGQ